MRTLLTQRHGPRPVPQFRTNQEPEDGTAKTRGGCASGSGRIPGRFPITALQWQILLVMGLRQEAIVPPEEGPIVTLTRRLDHWPGPGDYGAGPPAKSSEHPQM